MLRICDAFVAAVGVIAVKLDPVMCAKLAAVVESDYITNAVPLAVAPAVPAFRITRHSSKPRVSMAALDTTAVWFLASIAWNTWMNLSAWNFIVRSLSGGAGHLRGRPAQPPLGD
jgi:hypothetical protein